MRWERRRFLITTTKCDEGSPVYDRLTTLNLNQISNSSHHTIPFPFNKQVSRSGKKSGPHQQHFIMNLSTMWIVTFIGILVILFLLIASTAFRCLSSNTLASVLQIGAIVIFIVLFAFLMLFFLSSASDHHDNLEEFTKKAKARAKANYLKMLLSTTTSSPYRHLLRNNTVEGLWPGNGGAVSAGSSG